MILLVIVLLMIVVGVSSLGTMTRQGLTQLDFGGESSSHSDVSDDLKSPSPTRTAARQPATNENGPVRWTWIGIGVAVVLQGCLGALMFRRVRQERQRGEQLPIDEPTPTLDQNQLFVLRQRLLRILASHTSALFDGSLTVRHVMRSDVETVTPDAAWDEVAEQMRTVAQRYLLVCSKEKKLEGAIWNAGQGTTNTSRVADVMCREVPTVQPDTGLIQAITVLLHHGRPGVAVVENGRLIGELSALDAIMAWQATLQLLSRLGERVKPVLEENRGIRISDVVLTQESAVEI